LRAFSPKHFGHGFQNSDPTHSHFIVAFNPAPRLPDDNFEVDATGNWSKMATDLTIARLAQAGAMPIDTYAVLCELMSTWNRVDAMDFAAVMVEDILPPFRAVIESYEKAHAVQRTAGETKLEVSAATK